ncbi:DMT family transporter [Candidatus Micrarchaeota archaeon]|jgi:drug/metabolite transporter (DMT)-like permease|nr:DMT family transporter [Candidatus Micrarchaeota archaeon]
MEPSNKGAYLAIISAFFIGMSTIIASQVTKNVNPVLFASIYSLLSVPFLIAIYLLQKNNFNLIKLKSAFKEIMGVVITRNFFGSMLLMTGFSLTSGVRAVFLLGLDPVFVTILGAMFLKQKITRKQIFLIAVLLAGVFLLSTNLDFDSLGKNLQIGDLFVMAGVFCMSLAYFPSIGAMKKISAMELTIVSNLIGGLILLPVALLFFNAHFNIAMDIWGLVFAYTILFAVFALYAFYSALNFAKPWIVSSLLQLAPIPGVIFAFIWLGDVLSPVQIAGGLIIVICAYIISRIKHD